MLPRVSLSLPGAMVRSFLGGMGPGSPRHALIRARARAPSFRSQASSRRYSGHAVEVEEEGSVESDVGLASATTSGVRGATLAGFVAPSVLQALSTEERKRQEAIFEIINTESVYVRKLRVTIKVHGRRRTCKHRDVGRADTEVACAYDLVPSRCLPSRSSCG